MANVIYDTLTIAWSFRHSHIIHVTHCIVSSLELFIWLCMNEKVLFQVMYDKHIVLCVVWPCSLVSVRASVINSLMNWNYAEKDVKCYEKLYAIQCHANMLFNAMRICHLYYSWFNKLLLGCLGFLSILRALSFTRECRSCPVFELTYFYSPNYAAI